MTLIRCQVRDLQALDLSSMTSRRMTPEGYLVAPATLAMAGNIQKYAARELGLDKSHGMDSDRMVALYRPAAEVFRPETLKSFDGQPLTLDHPPAGVNAENYTSVNRGDVRDIVGAGDRMKGTIWVRDAAAVGAVTGGKSQLSCGYDFDLDLTSGTTADGTAYDGTMKNIVGNHLAIVDYARGGPGCRIGDKQPGETMATIKKNIDSVSIEFADDTGASFVERLVGELRGKIAAADAATATATERATKAETALVAMGEAGKKLATDHAAKVAELEGTIVKPEVIEAMAAERAKVIGDAALLAKDLKTDGKTVGQIRVDVLTSVVAKDARAKKLVTAILGADAALEKPENAPLVRAAFDAVVAECGTTVSASGNDGFGRALANPPAQDGAAGGGAGGAGRAQDGASDAALPDVGTVFESDKPVGREARMAADTNAWQPKTATKA